ncbi:hypothetical protein BJY01DRAFT_38372 [Aspergillus pseudoustus]|uniref:Uncharacterized protein n=1 Tax=Aspergillus pseudoustus TaxID=1810923 RepID=A0ABR4JG61_9EURO
MKTLAILSLGLLSTFQAAMADVQVEINEIIFTDGRPSRHAIVDLPYIDDSVLPKDQPCPALPFGSRNVRLLTGNLTVPTFCYLYSQYCHDAFGRIDNEEPFADHPPGAVWSVRCFVDDDE